MKLSIIIPMYNVEKYVEKCLRSCAEQDLPSDDYEIIVINDGTKDNSLEIVENVAKDYSNITIISQENQGLSAARNKGLSLANGEYIWFVDSDDWIQENCLLKIITKFFNEDLDILAICAANYVNSEYHRRFSFEYSDVLSGRNALVNRKIQACVPFSIYRRSFLVKNDLKFYIGIFHEDSEFSPRTYYLANKVSFLNDIIYFVNQNPNSITRTINPKKAYDCITVSKSLSLFSENVLPPYKFIFDDLISMTINTSFTHTYYMKVKEVEEFNKLMYDNRYLFKHLLRSKTTKYKIEGVLFYLFHKKTSLIYKFIQKLNK